MTAASPTAARAEHTARAAVGLAAVIAVSMFAVAWRLRSLEEDRIADPDRAVP
jgi:hypothetical protein